jgi:purine/pyrimidine-nucleoside phosphorylase
MLKVNEYFDGKVKSIALENAEGVSTVGVISEGEYEFGTATVEYMTVVSGALRVQLPGNEEWELFGKGETFVVEKGLKFKVQAQEPTAYLCIYK